jgi:hypothetical protein
MRIPQLLITSGVVSVLLAACASGARDDSQTSQQAVPTPSTTRASTTVTSTKPVAPPTTAPTKGAPISDVIRWIEAGNPVDPGGFHTASRDGATVALDNEVAFVTAGTEANCVTNSYQDGALSCLVKLTDPPPRPESLEGVWKGNWIDFAGTTLDVGSTHGDPGPFVNGTGAELAAGQTLSFGDYRCRADVAGLFCVNYAHQSAVAMSAADVEPFGCLQPASSPPGIGRHFSC